MPKVGFLGPIFMDHSKMKGHVLQDGPSATARLQKTLLWQCISGEGIWSKCRVSIWGHILPLWCFPHAREWGEVSQGRVEWYAWLWFSTKIKHRVEEHAQTGNHLFPCAAAMTAMLILDLPYLKEKSKLTKIGPDSCKDKPSPSLKGDFLQPLCTDHQPCKLPEVDSYTFVFLYLQDAQLWVGKK